VGLRGVLFGVAVVVVAAVAGRLLLLRLFSTGGLGTMRMPTAFMCERIPPNLTDQYWQKWDGVVMVVD